MTVQANDPAISVASEKPASLRPFLEWIARHAEPVVIGLAAILIGLALFSLFILAVAAGGRSIGGEARRIVETRYERYYMYLMYRVP